MIEIKVNKNIISVQETEPITSGSVSVYKCHFVFDPSWDGFFRSAVFRCGSMVNTVPLDDDDMCDLPWELLAKQYIGMPVEVSVYGTKDETEILPTIWDKLGRVRSGSEPGDDVKEPTPNTYDRITSLVKLYADKIQTDVTAVENAAVEAEASARSAANSLAQMGTSVSDAREAADAAAEAKFSAESAAESVAEAMSTVEAAKDAAAESESNAAAYASSAQESAERAEESKIMAESAITAASEAKSAAETATAQAVVSTDAASEAAASAAQARDYSGAAEDARDAAQTAQTNAEAAQRAAEQARDEAQGIAGGDFASTAYVDSEVASAENRAKGYTDAQIAAIPTPDVSGQIATHNTDTSAHSDIRGAIPTKVSDLANDSGFITGYTETDPTVPAWAKAASKPTYTASEVGADASGSAASALASAKAYADGIKPTKTSQLANDSGFITDYTETDPTVPAWAKAASKPTYTYSEVGAAPIIQFGTTDVTAGSASTYPEGTLYVVIE